MRRIDHEQGTPEWHAWRRTRRMASYAPALMGASKYQSRQDVLDYYVRGSTFSGNAATRYGHENEHQARAYAAGIIGDFLMPTCIEDDEGVYGSSLDGFTDCGRHIVEAKCPYKGTDSPIWRDVLDNSAGGYEWQIQHQLMVSGAESCLYVVWTPDDARHLWRVRDQAAQDALRRAWDALWQDVLARRGTRDDLEWIAACDRWRRAKEAADAADKELETARKALLAIRQSDHETGAGVRLQKIERAGAVDYSKVPELAGVDLTPYRKAASVSWRIEDIGEAA